MDFKRNPLEIEVFFCLNAEVTKRFHMHTIAVFSYSLGASAARHRFS